MPLAHRLGKSLYRKLDDYLHGEFFWKLGREAFYPNLKVDLRDKLSDRFKAQLERPFIARGRALAGKLREDLSLTEWLSLKRLP